MDSESKLLEFVDALGASCGFAGGLHCGQQKGDQHTDNRDDNEKFDKSETG
jgi:hypothetical protein